MYAASALKGAADRTARPVLAYHVFAFLFVAKGNTRAVREAVIATTLPSTANEAFPWHVLRAWCLFYLTSNASREDQRVGSRHGGKQRNCVGHWRDLYGKTFRSKRPQRWPPFCSARSSASEVQSIESTPDRLLHRCGGGGVWQVVFRLPTPREYHDTMLVSPRKACL